MYMQRDIEMFIKASSSTSFALNSNSESECFLQSYFYI